MQSIHIPTQHDTGTRPRIFSSLSVMHAAEPTHAQNETPPPATPTPAPAPSKRPPARTFGLKAFDAFFYFLTNVGVFAISVFFTYLTNRGNSRVIDGEVVHAIKVKNIAEHLVEGEKLFHEPVFDKLWKSTHISSDELTLNLVKKTPAPERQNLKRDLRSIVTKMRASIQGAPHQTDELVAKAKGDIAARFAKVHEYVETQESELANRADSPYGTLAYGKLGRFFNRRGEWLVDKFKGMGLSAKRADEAKMVFFSFIDGSLLAPFVKLFEDRRGKISKSIDSVAGTKPKDDSVYDQEPAQTWSSVLLGRLFTVVIVVATAVGLNKVKFPNKTLPDEEIPNLNDIMFHRPGKTLGRWVKEKFPQFSERFAKHDLADVFRTSAFEAFYTTVCTVGLYVISRFIARKGEQISQYQAMRDNKDEAPVVVKGDGVDKLREGFGPTNEPVRKRYIVQLQQEALNPPSMARAV